MNTMQRTVGDVLRDWRRRRHFSQLDLANEAGVSARHLSFLESGRSQPSRELLLRLADTLEVPLHDPALSAVRQAVDLVLQGHEPYPALAVDRYWTLVAANRAAYALLTGIPEHLLAPPLNVLRLVFHPEGLAPRIANRSMLLPQLIERLRHEITVSGDPRLEALHDELIAYPAMQLLEPHRPPRPDIS